MNGTNISLNNAYAASTFPGLNQWVMVTATYDGNAAKMYINGVLGGSSNISSSVTSTNMFIGASNSGGYQDFPGLIDDVRIYNRALSAAEVQALYNAEK